eukprot:1595551-Pleurochrysis_carterae.AAC.2
MSNKGVLADVRTIGQRKGAAAPSLHVLGVLSASISPREGKSRSQAVVLSINKGDTQELPLEAAMVALGLQLEPLRRPRAAPGQRALHATTLRGPTATDSRLAGAPGEPRVARRCVSQLRKLGVMGGGPDGAGATPRDVAHFAAEAAGDMSVVDAVQEGVASALAMEE